MTVSSISRFLSFAFLGLSLAACGSLSGNGLVEWGDHGAGTRAEELTILKGVYAYRNGSLANEMIRIVAIDGRKVPGQFGVAEGADAVSLLPGVHEVKLLWVHGANELDYFVYSTVQLDTRPNCVYSFHSTFGNDSPRVQFAVNDQPTTPRGNQACGKGVLSQKRLES
jgi:hypothetical protein